MSVDLAALGIGRQTGASSKLVTGEYDHHRPISIIDLRLLAVNSENIGVKY